MRQFKNLGHQGPVSRRDFLAVSLQSAVAGFALPSLFDLLIREKRAWALDCGTRVADLMPFLVFDCIGGASLSGNWVVGKQGGAEDFLQSYDTMGIPTSPVNGEPVDRQFGTPMYTNFSKIREGLLVATSPDTRTRLRMVSFCNASQDDSGDNMLSPLMLVSQFGLQGKYFKTGLGSLNSLSGGRSKCPVNRASLKPLFVSGVDDITGALSYGPILSNLSAKQRESIAKALVKLSRTQASSFDKFKLGDQIKQLAECGYLKNMEYITPPNDIDPRRNADCQSIYGINSTTISVNAQLPAVVYNVLKRNCGPGVIAIPGCDYHDGTQTTGDAKDLEIGTHIGRAVELASRLKSPLAFSVITDGSVYSDKGTRVWRGDAGVKGLAIMGVFNPQGAPPIRFTQVGHYTDGQGVERTTYVGSDPKRVSYAIFANYLNLHGKLGEFSNQVPNQEFDSAQIDGHIAF